MASLFRKKIVVAALLAVLGVAVVSGGILLASSTNGHNRQKPADFMKQQLSKLVSAGTISQEKADKIIEFFEKNAPPAGKGQGGPLAQLISQGILTQDEANAVVQKMNEYRDKVRETKAEARADAMKEVLSELVSEGTISQDKADKIVEFFEKNTPPAGKGRGQGGPLSQLVSQGILTQDEANAVAKVMPGPRGGHRGPCGPQGQARTQASSSQN